MQDRSDVSCARAIGAPTGLCAQDRETDGDGDKAWTGKEQPGGTADNRSIRLLESDVRTSGDGLPTWLSVAQNSHDISRSRWLTRGTGAPLSLSSGVNVSFVTERASRDVPTVLAAVVDERWVARLTHNPGPVTLAFRAGGR